MSGLGSEGALTARKFLGLACERSRVRASAKTFLFFFFLVSFLPQPLPLARGIVFGTLFRGPRSNTPKTTPKRKSKMATPACERSRVRALAKAFLFFFFLVSFLLQPLFLVQELPFGTLFFAQGSNKSKTTPKRKSKMVMTAGDDLPFFSFFLFLSSYNPCSWFKNEPSVLSFVVRGPIHPKLSQNRNPRWRPLGKTILGNRTIA